MSQMVGQFLINLLNLYSLVLLARIILSWVGSLDTRNPLINFVIQVTEPVLGPVRQMIPPLGGMIDLSPLLVFFGIRLLQSAIAGLF